MTTRFISALAIVCCCAVSSAFAQDASSSAPYVPTPRTAVNTIYAELLGNAGLYSLNYERMLQDNFGLRIGASYFGFNAAAGGSSAAVSLVSFPLMANYFVGTEASRLELGLGLLLANGSASVVSSGSSSSSGGFGASLTSTIAYRLQPPQGGFNFKIGATPSFSLATGTFQLWGGISAGFGF